MSGNDYDVDAAPGVPADDGEPWTETAARLEETRGRIRAAADALRAHPRVLAVDTLAPGTGPHTGWTLEATLDTSTCWPGVLRTLADKRLHVREARPRGTGYHVVATA